MYRLLVELLQPFTILYVAVLVGLIVLWRRKPENRRLRWLAIPLVVLTILCTPAMAYFALGSLEWQYPPREGLPEDVDTLVVLSGYAFRADAVRKVPVLAMDSQFRCSHAAYLYREYGPLRIVVSGGKVDPDDKGASLAEMMRDYLVRHGVAESDIVVEQGSRNTYENASATAEVLAPYDVEKIGVVTTATHLPRAVWCFEKQGFEVTAVGTDYLANHFNWSILSFVPRIQAAGDIHRVFHEWLGIAIYKARGRI